MKWVNKGHEFDEIGNLLNDKRHIYLYGAGGNAKEIFTIIQGARKWIDWEVHFVDKSEEKQRNGYMGMKVISPEKFFSIKKENFFVVACPNGDVGDEIFNLLKTAGIKEDNIFHGEYFIYTYIGIYFLYKHDLVFFTSQSIVPSTFCNLKCRDCLNFMPYIQNHKVYDFEKLKKDIDVFFGAVDLIYRFQITGGEPFLYANIKDVIKYIALNYKEKILRFEIVTNGTIIPSNELCELIKASSLYVVVDDYTKVLPEKLAIKNSMLKKKFLDYGIQFLDNHVEKWFQIFNGEKNNIIRQNEVDLKDIFSKCDNPFSSIENGRISACNYALYAEKANLVEHDDNDYYDLTSFKIQDKKELLEFRLRHNEKGYVEFCKKCNGYYKINNFWDDAAIQVDGDKYEVDK